MPDGWLSLSTDPFKSRRAQLSALPLIFDQGRPSIPGRAQHEPRNDKGRSLYVSTNPALDPLATESLCP